MQTIWNMTSQIQYASYQVMKTASAADMYWLLIH